MFSIIIPTLNEEHYLPRLLKAITAQSISPREIIVADARSTDQTAESARNYGCRVVAGGLPGIGRNAGARIARSGTLLFLDADVWFTHARFLETALREFDERRLDIATCDILPGEGPALNYFMYETYNTYARATQKILPHAPGFCIFVRRNLHARIGGFDETVRVAEDHEYVQRAARAGAYGILNVGPVVTSMRRFRKDGALRTATKYFLMELHMAMLGPIRHNGFKYGFGYKE